MSFNQPREPELAELAIADPPDAWRALGFEVNQDDNLDIGQIRVRMGGKGDGITGWSLLRVNAMGSIDGIPTPVPRMLHPPPFFTHPNGATGIDHVVMLTPAFDRTAAALHRAGVELKREQESKRGRMGFRRLGPVILEVVESHELEGDDPKFWGLAFVVISLEELAERLGDRLGPIKPAVQPGRWVATLSEEAGVSPAVAFMSPEPP